jgi:hypothetical protein
MVRRQMGLLDDAIRDHLELKRRRGADPSEVAREQSEALPAVIRGRPLSSGYAPSDDVTPEAIAAAGPERTDRVPSSPDSPGEPVMSSRAHLDQDTAEFDMALVLSGSPEASGDEFPPARKIIMEPSPEPPTSELQDEAMEWDFPGAGTNAVAFPEADPAPRGTGEGALSDRDQLL